MTKTESISSSDNTSAVTGMQSQVQDYAHKFKTLAGAIQSGNLGSAQQALASFQTTSQKASASGINPLDQTPQLKQAYQSITNSLQSGNINSAQSALNNLSQELSKTEAVQQAVPRVKRDDDDASTPSTQVPGVSLNAVA